MENGEQERAHCTARTIERKGPRAKRIESARPGAQESLTKPASAWAPLARPVYRMLWLTWLTSNVCMWMNDVAAAWLMTSLTSAPVMIALVQSAATLPVFLL